jgi:hypothetical protein
MKALVLCALLSCACSGSLQQARADGVAARQSGELRMAPAELSERCQQLDDRRAWAGAVVLGGAVVTGASGVAALPVEQLPEEHQGTARYAAAGTALVAATVTAIAAEVERASAESWVRECQP